MMQLHASGRLVSDPAQKTSANGKAYVQALVTAGSGDGDQLVTLMAFDPDLANLLVSLRKGDSLTTIGSASIRAYSDKAGQLAAGVTLMVSRLMAMSDRQAAPRPRSDRQPADRRQSRRTDERQYQPADPRDFASDPFLDSVPF